MSATVRAPRKCSQCRQEGCNKGKATCPVNIERTGGAGVVPVVVRPVKKRLCGECRREGCSSNNMMCPVKIEIDRHYELAAQMQRLPEPNNPTRQYEETVFNHIEDPVCRIKLSINLYYKIQLNVNRIMRDVQSSYEKTRDTLVGRK
jgi:hypothetical protein